MKAGLSCILILASNMFGASSFPNKGGAAFVPNKDATPVSPADNEIAVTMSTARDLSADLDSIIDKDLIDDIEMLSSMLSSIVKKENPLVYDLYTQLRKHGIDRAADPDDTEAFEAMKKLSFDISPSDALGVMRIFSIALNLVNAAEVHHRLRVTRNTELMEASKHTKNVGPLPLVEDSIPGTLDILLEEGHSPDDIFERLLEQKVEIVITAHPTEGKSQVTVSTLTTYVLFRQFVTWSAMRGIRQSLLSWFHEACNKNTDNEIIFRTLFML